MACFKSTLTLLALALLFWVQAALGEITCEHLDQETCSYAISSTGKRCVLEKQLRRSGQESYSCRTSEIEADRLRNWIETDECIKSCGLDRKSLGISSDSLLESSFTRQLCSPQCHDSCPNIIDLYFNLAAGEGVFLPKLCEATEGNTRRGLMAEMRSSGIVAPGPIHAATFSVAPVVAPAVAPGPIQEATYSVAPVFEPAMAPGPIQAATYSVAPVFEPAMAPGPIQAATYSVAPVFEPAMAPGPIQAVKYSDAPVFAPAMAPSPFN